MIAPMTTAVTSVLQSTRITQDGGTLRPRGHRERFIQCGFIFHRMCIVPAGGVLFSLHGRLQTAATLILPHIAITTIMSWGRRILGAIIGIAVASAPLTATQRTIAKRPLGIDSVAARSSQLVLRSSSLAEVCLRHLQPQLLQLPLRLRRLLQVRLLQLCHQRLHRLRRPLHRHRHLQRCSTALAFRTQIATATHGVQMKLMLIGAQLTVQVSARRPNAW
jgi:hypothetical protein